MFSVITNIYNKKTKGPYLMEFFTVTGKLKKVFFFLQLEMFDVCTTGEKAHIGTIIKFLPHTRVFLRQSLTGLNAAVVRKFGTIAVKSADSCACIDAHFDTELMIYKPTASFLSFLSKLLQQMNTRSLS